MTSVGNLLCAELITKHKREITEYAVLAERESNEHIQTYEDQHIITYKRGLSLYKKINKKTTKIINE